jgi:hypothetical protein
MKRALCVVLLVAASCVADRAPSHAGETHAEGGAATIPLLDEPADAEVAPSATSDASAEDAGSSVDAASVDASDAEAPRPLVVKGIRKCDEEEVKNEVCFEKRRAGMCLDGYCVTNAVCPRYCAARGAYDYADCPLGDPTECQGVPECVQAFKQMRVTCANIQKQTTDHCTQHTCALVRTIPPPP